MFDDLNLTLTLAQDDPRPPAGNDGGAPAPAGNGAAETGQDGARHGEGGGNGNGNGEGDTGGGGGGGGSGLGGMLPILLLFLVVMFGMTFLSQRREKKKRQAMLAELGKNDRVVTIGGVIGTVVEVRDAEVVLKVDESSNTRMRFSRAAIQSVIADPDELPSE